MSKNPLKSKWMGRIEKGKKLNYHERDRVYSALGLDKLSYYFLEYSGDKVLSYYKMIRNEKIPIWETAKLGHIFNAYTPLISLQHMESFLIPDKKWDTSQSLHESILPYPFLVLPKLLQYEKTTKFIQPESFYQWAKDFCEAMDHIEAVVSNYELSCIYIEGKINSAPLLFHYVQKKIRHVELNEDLQSLRDLFIEGDLTNEKLNDFFQARSCFLFLKLDEIEVSDSKMTEIIKTLLGPGQTKNSFVAFPNRIPTEFSAQSSNPKNGFLAGSVTSQT